jgi:hypothetical protein
MKTNSVILLAAVLLLFANCGSVDTHANRKEKAQAILRNDCSGLCNAMVDYLKTQASIETDTWYEKAGETAIKFAVGMECNCLSEKLAEAMADKYSLAEINAMEGKSINEITQLPAVLISAAPQLKKCIPFQ